MLCKRNQQQRTGWALHPHRSAWWTRDFHALRQITIPPISALELRPYRSPPHQSASKTTTSCKGSQEMHSWDHSDPPPGQHAEIPHTENHTGRAGEPKDTCSCVKDRSTTGWRATGTLTFWWHPVFVRTARQAPMVGVQARYVTCAVTARRRTPTLLLVCAGSI